MSLRPSNGCWSRAKGPRVHIRQRIFWSETLGRSQIGSAVGVRVRANLGPVGGCLSYSTKGFRERGTSLTLSRLHFQTHPARPTPNGKGTSFYVRAFSP